MNSVIVSPSILNASKFKLKKQMKKLTEKGVEYFHFDVMDGKFVKNKTFNEKFLLKFKKMPIKKDVHLMIEHPELVAEKYIKNGADILTVHYEAFGNVEDCKKCLVLIRKLGAQAGLSIKPQTSFDVLKELIPYLDLILVMSVEPGEGGQPFIENTYLKISRIKQLIIQKHGLVKIEVDGGINDKNIGKVVKSGADMVVVGSFLFKAKNIQENYDLLWNGLNI